MNKKLFNHLRCPLTHSRLALSNKTLRSTEGNNEYQITKSGVPILLKDSIIDDSIVQSKHFDIVASLYATNLKYPHTQEYMKYLDDEFLTVIENKTIGLLGEVCCGTAESFNLVGPLMQNGIGVDISIKMLELAQSSHDNKDVLFVRGDATSLPLNDNIFDAIIILGGIHHVNNRKKLFSEVERTLKKDGTIYWREPVDDFFLWRWIRKVIYKISPSLDDKTEAPIRYADTKKTLESTGLKLIEWKTLGFLGFCLFMNSDILVFNRLFRFIPRIRYITKFAIYIDKLILKLPFMSKNGLIAIGAAKKTNSHAEFGTCK